MSNESGLISKVWNFAHVLRDDGVGYGDYLEQITYLLFLKMAEEMSKPPYNKEIKFPRIKDTENKEIPNGEICDWHTLSKKRGAELEAFYSQMLRSLATEKGILGQIFTKSQNKIQDPAKLLKVIDMIGKENWMVMGSDVKGDIYEGLLEKNAEDTKSGAGQYFTPRALIKAMVECVRPEPVKSIHDPACGTGGFLLAAYDYLTKHHKLDRDQKAFLKNSTFSGNEIVASTRRMCLMNMFLHNIGEIDGDTFISPNDALISDEGIRVDYVLANPPFGKKSSMTITNENGEQKKTMQLSDLQEFIDCYNPSNRHQRKETWSEGETKTTGPDGRWRKFTYEEIITRDKTNLDIFWLKDKSLADLDNLPDPDVLAGEIIEKIEAGLKNFREIMEVVKNN